MSGVQSSRSVKLSQIRLRLSNILIKIKKEDSKVKPKTACKPTNITGRHLWISLYLTSLIHQGGKSKREFYNLKKDSSTIISTYLEERAKEESQIDNLQEEREIHTLVTIRKSKDRAIRLRFLQPRQRGAWVPRLTIETNTANGDGNTKIREVEQKRYLETI